MVNGVWSLVGRSGRSVGAMAIAITIANKGYVVLGDFSKHGMGLGLGLG